MQAAPGTEGAGYSGERPGGHNEHLTLHQAQLGERLYPRVCMVFILLHVLTIRTMFHPDGREVILISDVGNTNRSIISFFRF